MAVVTDHGWLFCPDGLPTAACFNTDGSYAYAHIGISLQEWLTPVLLVSGSSNSEPVCRHRGQTG